MEMMKDLLTLILVMMLSINAYHYQNHIYLNEFILKMHLLLLRMSSFDLYSSFCQYWPENLTQCYFLFAKIIKLLFLVNYFILTILKNFNLYMMLYCCIFLYLLFKDLFHTLLGATISFISIPLDYLGLLLDHLSDLNCLPNLSEFYHPVHFMNSLQHHKLPLSCSYNYSLNSLTLKFATINESFLNLHLFTFYYFLICY